MSFITENAQARNNM